VTTTNATTITAPPGTPFLDVIRDFQATPAQLFRAATDPALVIQWLGPRNRKMEIEEWDVRPGGRYRYVHSGCDGDDMRATFHGVFHTVRPDELTIQTFEFDGAPDQVCLESHLITDLGDGRVRLAGRSVFPSVEARDMALASGMTFGIEESMERLTELLATDDRRESR
jgi:uncharacterized protein YndB with AHSA1/START domain